MAQTPSISSQTFGHGTPILMIHGWPIDGACEMLDFEPIFADKPGYLRIYPDLPGMGQSYLGAAALHQLESYNVQSLDIGALLSDSTRVC